MITKAVVLPTLMLAMLSMYPSSLGGLKFVPIFKSLTVRANKKLPPHIAYLDSHFESQNNEWNAFEKKPKHALTLDTVSIPQQGPYILTQKRVLEGITIRKSPEIILAAAENTRKTPLQSVQENEGPRWLQNIVRQPASMAMQPSAADLSLAGLTAAKRITGHIELKDGLAVTNEHHIEVRRSDEGIFREVGRVDLARGSYSIDVDEPTGFILARLMDKSGHTLGEGSIRLAQAPTVERLIVGPRLEIAPSPTWIGNVGSYYPKSKGSVGVGAKAYALAGASELQVSPTGKMEFENIARGSTTIVRATLPDHMASNKIMIAGERNFQITNFPLSMMSAMKNIVGAGASDDSSVVWGTVTLDGQALSGVTVTSETEPEAKTIYFNEFMIPDPKLTSTSTNGLYAFVGLQEGFHAILAQRGEAYFGHQNVEVEPATVSIGDIQSTLRTEPVRIRSFDAFAGEPVRAVANMQSLTEPVELVDGTASAILPQVSRLSMIYTEVPPLYVAANYFYNDQDSYIHLPMLKKEWLFEMKVNSKVNEVPRSATVVGFFSEENFEAFLADAPRDSGLQIVYFDAAGKVTTKGSAGGGFVMFNVPAGTQEIVLMGADSERVYSKVVPVDVDTTSVLNFTSL